MRNNIHTVRQTSCLQSDRRTHDHCVGEPFSMLHGYSTLKTQCSLNQQLQNLEPETLRPCIIWYDENWQHGTHEMPDRHCHPQAHALSKYSHHNLANAKSCCNVLRLSNSALERPCCSRCKSGTLRASQCDQEGIILNYNQRDIRFGHLKLADMYFPGLFGLSNSDAFHDSLAALKQDVYRAESSL